MRVHLLVLGFLTLATSAYANDDSSPTARGALSISDHVQSGTSGTEFWMAIPKDEAGKDGSRRARFEIHVTSQHETQVALYYPASPAFVRERSVKPGIVTVFSSAQNDLQDEFWVSLDEARNNTKVRKGLCLSSQHPVTVTYYSFVGESVEACRVMPYHTLGLEYRHTSYYSHFNNQNSRDGGCLILATRRNTRLDITLSGTPGSRSIDGRHKVGDRFTVSLDSGQVYILAAKSDTAKSADLSGSLIKADKPVAVMAFHSGTRLPLAAESETSSLLVEMLPPITAWGQTHVAMMTQLPSTAEVGNHYRIMAAEDNTVYSMTQIDRFDGSILAVRDGIISKAGEWNEFGEGNPESGGGLLTDITVWSTDKPVLVTQYGVSHSANGSSPFMTCVPPIEQYVTGKTTIAIPPGVAQIQVLALNHSSEVPGDLTSVKINDLELGQLDVRFYTNQIPNTNLFWSSHSVTPGQTHTLSSKTPYAVLLHGAADNGHYGSNVIGAAYKVDQPDNVPPVLQSSTSCTEFRFVATELTIERKDGEDIQIDQGISNIRLLPELSENFKLRLNDPPVLEPYKGEQKVQFTLQPLDIKRDGQAVFMVEDRAGNVTVETVSYFYQPDEELVGVNRSSYDFGIVRLGQQPTTLLEIENPSASEILVVEDVFFASPNSSFFVKPLNGPTLIPPSGFMLVEVAYAPTRVNAGSANSDTDTLVVQSACRDVRLTTVRGQAGLPNVEDIGSLDFGMVVRGEEKCHTQFISIRNSGQVPLSVDLPDLAAQFTNDISVPFKLLDGEFRDARNPVPPGQSLNLQVLCFAPKTIGEFTHRFTVKHDGAGDKYFELKGEGTLTTSAEEALPGQRSELAILPPYPHPIQDQATIRVFTPQQGPITWKLLDMRGAVVLNGELRVFTAGLHALNLELLDTPPGVYIFECYSSGRVQRMTLGVR